MYIPEQIIADEVLPGVRHTVSRELRSRGWSQSRIGNVLGISQVMVSRYLKEELKTAQSMEDIIHRISTEITAGALSGEDIEKLSVRFGSVMEDCIEEGMLSARFRERFGIDPPGSIFLRRGGSRSRERVMIDMGSALSLLKGKDLGGLVPALRINIVHSIPEPSGPEDVASFPGRLQTRDGEVKDARPPEFGSSKHLSRILIRAMEYHKGIHSAGSIFYSQKIKKALEAKPGFRVLNRSQMSIEEALKSPEPLSYLADPGDFGVEPCLYIFSHSSLEVAMTMISIKESIDEMEGS